MDKNHNKRPSQWAKSNAQHIERAIAQRYGVEWRNCFPESVQEALVAQQVLSLVMTQALDKYEPAQAMVREINAILSPDQEISNG